ncbi:sensor histidine kinase [Nocardia concava]|uniref:sensor histidine kinase n=1 Tax=Nocardia concava TaxID=257281 RepID=UPI000319153A|nr:histidine kinase [Nocardia concava]
MSAIRIDSRGWITEGVVAMVVLIAGAAEAAISIRYNVFPNRGSVAPIVVAVAAQVGLARRWPPVALAVVWLTYGLQIITGAPVLLTQAAAAALVVFGTARWGASASVTAGALTVPIIGVAAALSGSSGVYGTFLIVTLLGVCWMAGLALRRFADRATRSLASQHAAEADAARAHRESVQANEIARLREQQAQLALDVHDVVGHSLAVILAQAESAQYVPDTDALHASMADIATVARSSLRDVRQVLSAATPSESGPGELLTLVEGVRASGREVTFEQIGDARTLAPELATVAYRVVQEMLTNAVRHGDRDIPIAVELRWAADELRIETVNGLVAEEVSAGPGGRGLDGMRQRLESVGGRLDVHRDTERADATMTVTAWLPVRRLLP